MESNYRQIFKINHKINRYNSKSRKVYHPNQTLIETRNRIRHETRKENITLKLQVNDLVTNIASRMFEQVVKPNLRNSQKLLTLTKRR